MDQQNKIFEDAKRFIMEGKSFLLASHEKTDGDDLGSMLAMADVLERSGKTLTLAAKGGVPSSLQFLPRQHEVLDDINFEVDKTRFDGIILFGCNNKARTGLAAIETAKLPFLNIDHHADNQMFGEVNLVDAEKSSVAELIYDFIKFLGTEFNAEIAKSLLTGMFTDTGSFMHSNTQSSTLEAASELMKYGARVDKIFNSTYANKDVNTLKAWGKALENTRIDKSNGIAISAITAEEMKELGDLPDDAFGGIAEMLNTIPGTRFSIFLRQDGDMIKGSLRSEERKNVDVSAIAKHLGGGGHKLASGFKFPGKIIKTEKGSWKIEKV